jgi:hypothetical protein
VTGCFAKATAAQTIPAEKSRIAEQTRYFIIFFMPLIKSPPLKSQADAEKKQNCLRWGNCINRLTG